MGDSPTSGFYAPTFRNNIHNMAKVWNQEFNKFSGSKIFVISMTGTDSRWNVQVFKRLTIYITLLVSKNLMF